MLLQTTSGRETFRTGSSQFQVLVMPTRTLSLPSPQHIGIVARAANQSVPITSTQYMRHSAASGSMVDMGTWHQSTYELPPGIVLKLYGDKTVMGSSHGQVGGRAVRSVGSLLIQTRAEAALRRITFRVVGDPQCTFRDVKVEGRFDLLSLKEALQLGVAGIDMHNTREFTDTATLARLFSMTTLDAEIAGKRTVQTTKVKTDDGEVEVQTAGRRRALDLD